WALGDPKWWSKLWLSLTTITTCCIEAWPCVDDAVPGVQQAATASAVARTTALKAKPFRRSERLNKPVASMLRRRCPVRRPPEPLQREMELCCAKHFARDVAVARGDRCPF